MFLRRWAGKSDEASTSELGRLVSEGAYSTKFSGRQTSTALNPVKDVFIVCMGFSSPRPFPIPMELSVRCQGA